VLAAWTKIGLAAALRASSLPDDPALESYLFGYFPGRVRDDFADAVRTHRLRREIVIVEMVNALVDELGMTFVHRIARTAGASVVDVCRATEIAWRLARGAELAVAIRADAATLPDEIAATLALEDLCRRTTLWLLAHGDRDADLGAVAADLEQAVAPVRRGLSAWLASAESATLHHRCASLELAGLSHGAAGELAVAEWLPSLLDVATVARSSGLPLDVVAGRYYGLAEQVDFAWLDAQLAAVDASDAWAQRALEGVAADLRVARRRLARRERRGPDELAAVRRLVEELKAAGRAMPAALVVVAHELRALSEEAE
jgi:glutamate dehydrogenase